MDTKTVESLAGYNAAANLKMDTIIGSLGDSQWENELGGYFNSIRALCNHIYVCDFNWLIRFSGLRAFEYTEGGLLSKSIQYGTMVLESIGDYEAKRRILDEKISRFAKEVTQKDLDSTLEYTDSHGIKYARNFGGLLLHMFNHQTHHRGMISLYLEEMKIENDYSNLCEIL